MAEENLIGSAYVKIGLNTNELSGQFKQLESKLTTSASIIDKKLVTSFRQATRAASQMGNQINSALKSIVIAPLTLAGGIAIRNMFKSQGDEAVKASARFKASMTDIGSSMGRIGAWIMQSKIFGKSMFEWIDKFAGLLRKITADDVQKFVNAFKTAAITIAGISVAIRAMKFSSALLSALSMMSKLNIGGKLGAASGAGVNFLGSLLGSGLGAAGGTVATSKFGGKILQRGVGSAFIIPPEAASTSYAVPSLLVKIRGWISGIAHIDGLLGAMVLGGIKSFTKAITGFVSSVVSNVAKFIPTAAALGARFFRITAIFELVKGFIEGIGLEEPLKKLISMVKNGLSYTLTFLSNSISTFIEGLSAIPKGIESIGLLIGSSIRSLWNKDALKELEAKLRTLFNMPAPSNNINAPPTRLQVAQEDMAKFNANLYSSGNISNVTNLLQRQYNELATNGAEELKSLKDARNKLVEQAKNTSNAFKLDVLAKELEEVDKDIEKSQNKFEKRRDNIQQNLQNIDELIKGALISSGYRVDKKAIRTRLMIERPEFDMYGLQLKQVASSANLEELKKQPSNIDNAIKIREEEKNLSSINKMISDFNTNLSEETDKLAKEEFSKRVAFFADSIKESGIEQAFKKLGDWIAEGYKKVKESNNAGQQFISEKQKIEKENEDKTKQFYKERSQSSQDLMTSIQRSGMSGFAATANPKDLIAQAQNIWNRNKDVVEKFGKTGETGAAQEFVRAQQSFALSAVKQQIEQAKRIIELMEDAKTKADRDRQKFYDETEDIKKSRILLESFVGSSL